MKLVVDTNVLFTYFWEGSFSRSLLISKDLELVSPEYSLEELKEHKEEIKKKVRISESDFERVLDELHYYVNFISFESYSSFLKRVNGVPDRNDLDFLALALKLDVPVWTNDKHFKEQSLVKVYTTVELVKELESK